MGNQSKTILSGKVADYDTEMRGIIISNNNKYFLKGVIKDEEVQFEVENDGKQIKTRLLKVFKPSDARVKVPCEVYDRCGGCQLLHMNYETQLEMKNNMIKKLFLNLDKNLKDKIKPCLGMKNHFNYRNKNQVVLKNDPKYKLISGFYQENTHKVINYNDCKLQDIESNKIFSVVKEILVKMHINAYDEDRKFGLVRHILIKRSFKTNQVMVVIVTANENFPGRSNFVKALLSKCKNVKTIVQNINKRDTSAVLGDKNIVLYGPGTIIDELCGMKFLISTQSFYQINPLQTEVLYKTALKLCDLSKEDILLDAYSGVGTIGLIASPNVKKVISVELVKEAYLNGIQNAKLNNIKNVHFFNDDATKFIVNLANKKEKIDVVIMDPPRKGSDEAFLKAVVKLAPKKIVYVSCNPYTQVEDLKTLLNYYEIKHIQSVDMFPNTNNVECVVCLERR